MNEQPRTVTFRTPYGSYHIPRNKIVHNDFFRKDIIEAFKTVPFKEIEALGSALYSANLFCQSVANCASAVQNLSGNNEVKLSRYCNATYTAGENVKFIRCIREVEAQLEKGECILAAAIGVGNNCDADDIVFVDAPFAMEGVFLTTNRVLFFYEHDEFDMRDAGFCYIDSYDYGELRSLRFRLRRIHLYTNDPFADDDEDETHDYLTESVEVNVKEYGATRQSHFSIAMFKPMLLQEQDGGDQYEGMADKFLTWSDAIMDSFHDCDQYVDIVD